MVVLLRQQAEILWTRVPGQLGNIRSTVGSVLVCLADGPHKGRGGITAGGCLHIQLPIWKDLHMVHGKLHRNGTCMSVKCEGCMHSCT